MSQIKISALNDLNAAPASNDKLVIVDTSAGETKRIDINDLFTSPNVTGTLTADGLTVEQATASTVTLKSTKDGTWSSDEVLGRIDFYGSDTSGEGASNKVSLTVESKDTFGAAFDLEVKTSDGTNGLAKAATFANNNDISFYEDTGTTAKFFWDASAERLGIGTTSPSRVLHTSGDLVRFDNSAASGILILDTGNSEGWRVIVNADTSGAFTIEDMGTATSGAGTERMRIDSSGNLLVGVTAPVTLANNTVNGGVSMSGDGQLIAGRNNAAPASFKRTTSDGDLVTFHKDTFTSGSISVTGSSVAYNTSSDYRLKENVVEITDASSRVLALNPVRFNFITETEKTVDGFIAHEAQEIVPEAVTGAKDAVDDEGNPEYQGIDQSKLVPLLTAALQEALTEIADLKARVSALEV